MYLSFPPIPFLLFAISLVTVLGFYLAYRIQYKNAFDKVLLWALFYLFVHSSYVLIMELFFSNQTWRDQLMPFALGYGPLMLFGMLALKHNYVRLWEVLVNFIPFIVYLILFIAISTGLIDNTAAIQHRLSTHLFILGPLSFISYSIWSVFASKSIFKNRFSKKKLMFIFARVFMLFVSLIFIIMFFSKRVEGNQQAIYFLRFIVYCCMFFVTIMILSQVIDRLFRLQVDPRGANEFNRETKELSRYERSALSAAQLDIYEQRLIIAIKDERVYLNQELSLSSLSNHLRIPSHHLTQVFSVRIKQTFYQYINHYRIVYACGLLELPVQSITIEELAEKSGFNSKVSFNRQFKLIKGCTPSEYRSKLEG